MDYTKVDDEKCRVVLKRDPLIEIKRKNESDCLVGNRSTLLKVDSQLAKTKALVLSKAAPKKVASLMVGEIALCKMRGFCEWPCVVTAVHGIDRKMIEVEFFGDHTIHKAKIDNFFDIKQSFNVILDNLKRLKSPLYEKSIQEAEIAMGILPEQSILNQM